MAFIFSTSHLPETRVRRPDHLEDEEDDDPMQPMPRAGMVRAFSHLPEMKEAEDPSWGAQAVGQPFQHTEPDTPHENVMAAAKASGVFDVVRQQFNRDDSPHFMDEDGNIRPRQQSRPQGAADAPPQPVSHAPDDTSSWHRPPLTLKDLHPHGFDEGSFGSHASATGSPLLNDIVSRPHGGPTPGPMFNDLVYRYKGSPEDAKKQNWSLHQNAADVHGSAPQLWGSANTVAQKDGKQSGPGPVQTRDPNAPAPAANAPQAANASPQPTSTGGADPVSKLKEHVAKSRNPIFIRDYYDEKTPLQEKLLLKQLILSLKAPPGEKLPLPIANLQHWLNVENRPSAENEGPLEIPFENLSGFSVMKEGGEKLLKYFETHPDKALGEKNMFDWLRSHAETAGAGVPDTYWDTLVSGQATGIPGMFGYARPGNEEFYYGLGSATLTGSSSGIKGSVDKDNAARAEGNIVYTLKDRYDWNKNQGVTIPLTMEMIQKYLPKGVPLITPKSKSIQINDSFFHDLEKRGHGRSFDVQSKSPPIRFEWIQLKPGQTPARRLAPLPSTEHLQFEGPGVLP